MTNPLRVRFASGTHQKLAKTSLIQPLNCVYFSIDGRMSIARSHRNRAMSQQLLNCNQIDTSSNQAGCESVTEIVKSYVRYLGLSNRLREPHFRIAEVSFPIARAREHQLTRFSNASTNDARVPSFTGRFDRFEQSCHSES